MQCLSLLVLYIRASACTGNHPNIFLQRGREMKLVLLSLLLLPSVLPTAFDSISAVITSQDVKDGITSQKMSLTPGAKYRVYAVFSSTAKNDDYAKNVVIKGAENIKYSVADLAKPKFNTPYVLEDTKVLAAPITITDNNGAVTRVPFAIYIVNANSRLSGVISAQLANGKVDCSVAKITSSSCTILSAENAIELSGFQSSTSDPILKTDSIEVRSAGFDAIGTGNDVVLMTVTKEAVGSSVVISGPIATIYSKKGYPADFGFTVKRDAAWKGPLPPGATTSFLSNGFMNLWESYAMDVNNNVFTRSVDFGTETQVKFNPGVGNYYPDSGDALKFSCVKAGVKTVYDCAELAGRVQSDTCNSIELNVTKGKGTPTGPRFVVEVQTGPGGFVF